jgi:hypothetical protein
MNNYTETTLRNEGMRILIDKLGNVNAEKFISLIIREPFDYTEWQRDLFDNMSVRELSRLAMENCSKDDSNILLKESVSSE